MIATDAVFTVVVCKCARHGHAQGCPRGQARSPTTSPSSLCPFPQVCACVLAALFAVQGEVESPPSCFELLGFDVLLDARGRTWLLEANTSPSMEMHTPLDRAVKARLWHDVLAAVRPAPFDRLELIRVLQRRLGLAGRRAGRGRGLLLGTQVSWQHVAQGT